MTPSRRQPAAHPDYLEAPRLRPRDDFWGQVKRTVGGRPVDESQIAMIVDAVVDSLRLSPKDVVLDLACGNGALSARLYPLCGELLGVDYSDYLISVALEYFADPPRRHFICQDAASYVESEPNPERFTKVLCYGSFAYLSVEDAVLTLENLHRRFSSVQRVFIGNLPDLARASAFYRRSMPAVSVLTDPTSAIGIWRTEDQMAQVAAACGWEAEFRRMPDGWYGSHYRYDALLTRA